MKVYLSIRKISHLFPCKPTFYTFRRNGLPSLGDHDTSILSYQIRRKG